MILDDFLALLFGLWVAVHTADYSRWWWGHVRRWLAWRRASTGM